MTYLFHGYFYELENAPPELLETLRSRGLLPADAPAVPAAPATSPAGTHSSKETLTPHDPLPSQADAAQNPLHRGHPAGDDLTLIHGIAATTARRLASLGIKSYSQLAAANPEALRRPLNLSAKQTQNLIDQAQKRAA